MSQRLAVFIAIVVAVSPLAPLAAQANEQDAVRRAALDYVEGFYTGDTTMLKRSVHPDVRKYGYYVPRDSTKYAGEAMPWAEFISYANTVRQRGAPRANAPKEVVIYEVLDQTASAKVTAWWGVDYLLLAKEDGHWMIRMVLWQSPPPKKAG